MLSIDFFFFFLDLELKTIFSLIGARVLVWVWFSLARVLVWVWFSFVWIFFSLLWFKFCCYFLNNLFLLF